MKEQRGRKESIGLDLALELEHPVFCESFCGKRIYGTSIMRTGYLHNQDSTSWVKNGVLE